jgi:hypothetical protein
MYIIRPCATQVISLIAMLRNDRIINALSSTVTWAIVTGIVVIILTFDGVITNLPSYSLQSRNSSTVQLFFVVEVLFCIFIQFVYLRIINQKYTVNPTIGHFRKYSDIIYYVVTITQYIIVALLLLTLVEIEILNQYHTIILLIQMLLSLFLSAGVSTLLVFRFLLWIKNKRDYLIIAYAAVAILISINSISIAIFMSLEMQGKPTVIQPSVFWSNYQLVNYDLHQFQSNVLFASFVALWIASTLLLRRQRRKWGAIKFYIAISGPLLYYLGVIQVIISGILIQYNILSAVDIYALNVVNSILTKPVGGILFGVAFWMVARSISDTKISDYMKLSAIGIMLLSISNQDASIYLLPYPPFGLSTITFMGLSSYLLFIGIYYSSISISMSAELRKTIESSVEEQFKFVSKIGTSQMENEIQNRVKGITRRSAKILEENSGIQAQLESKDIEEYISLVLQEKQKLLSKDKDLSNDTSD